MTKCLSFDDDPLQGAVVMRKEHRIIGSLVGAFPQHKQQNQFHALPLLLNPEEVSLALRNRWIRLIDGSVPYSEPTEEDACAYHKQRDEDQRNLEKAYEEQRKREIQFWKSKQHLPAEKRRKQNCGNASNEGKEEGDQAACEAKEEQCDADHLSVERSQRGTTTDTMIRGTPGHESFVLSVRNSILPWKRPEREISLEEWATLFPKTESEALRERVYEDLWHRGYFISTASKFGAHFLVYPGKHISLYIYIHIRTHILHTTTMCSPFS